LAGAVGCEEPGYAERRVGPESARVEVVIVDAPVKHMNSLCAAGGPHVNRIVLDDEVLPLDQFDAHLLRQKSMLEIRRVVGPGRKHRDLGTIPTGGSDCVQG